MGLSNKLKEVPYKDRIYFTQDILDRLVERGHDKNLVLAFIDFVSKEVLSGVRSENIVDIHILNFGTFYLPLSNALRKVLSFEEALKKNPDDTVKRQIIEKELSFWTKKYKNLLKHNMKLKKKAKRTKFNSRKIKNKQILNG